MPDCRAETKRREINLGLIANALLLAQQWWQGQGAGSERRCMKIPHRAVMASYSCKDKVGAWHMRTQQRRVPLRHT